MTEFKKGDWVIGWHAEHKDFRKMAWQIGEVDGNFIHPLKNISYSTENCDIRHATPDEIIKAGGQIEPIYEVF